MIRGIFRLLSIILQTSSVIEAESEEVTGNQMADSREVACPEGLRDIMSVYGHKASRVRDNWEHNSRWTDHSQRRKTFFVRWTK